MSSDFLPFNQSEVSSEEFLRLHQVGELLQHVRLNKSRESLMQLYSSILEFLCATTSTTVQSDQSEKVHFYITFGPPPAFAQQDSKGDSGARIGKPVVTAALWDIESSDRKGLAWFGEHATSINLKPLIKMFPNYFTQIHEEVKRTRAKLDHTSSDLYVFLSIDTWFILVHYPTSTPPASVGECLNPEASEGERGYLAVPPSPIFLQEPIRFSGEFLYALARSLSHINGISVTHHSIFTPPLGVERQIADQVQYILPTTFFLRTIMGAHSQLRNEWFQAILQEKQAHREERNVVDSAITRVLRSLKRLRANFALNKREGEERKRETSGEEGGNGPTESSEGSEVST